MPRPISKRGTLADTPTIYGYSAEKNPLHVWQSSPGRAEVLLFAGIHGEEPDTTVLLSRALRSVSQRSSKCAVVLCANPDGLRYGTRGNGNGVDLNRNFPSANWTEEPVTHRWTVSSESTVVLSTGEHPRSEPEVAALMQLVSDLEPEVVVAMHSPLGLIDDPDNTELGRVLAERTGMPRTVLPNHHTPGSFGSWALEAGVKAVTYELPNMTLWDMLPLHLPVLEELLEQGLSIT